MKLNPTVGDEESSLNGSRGAFRAIFFFPFFPCYMSDKNLGLAELEFPCGIGLQ